MKFMNHKVKIVRMTKSQKNRYFLAYERWLEAKERAEKIMEFNRKNAEKYMA